jgi:hypothetical protein
MTRFLPRFSLRSLALVVTLACAYFGAWEATKRHGIPAVKNQEAKLTPWHDQMEYFSPMPFLVSGTKSYAWRRVYLWFGAEFLVKLD